MKKDAVSLWDGYSYSYYPAYYLVFARAGSLCTGYNTSLYFGCKGIDNMCIKIEKDGGGGGEAGTEDRKIAALDRCN